MHASEIRQVGVGELLARLEALKSLLAEEGLFANDRKVALPVLPRKIGLICGRNTDAEQDVVEAIVPLMPIVLPVAGAVLIFLLAFIAVSMA